MIKNDCINSGYFVGIMRFLLTLFFIYDIITKVHKPKLV